MAKKTSVCNITISNLNTGISVNTEPIMYSVHCNFHFGFCFLTLQD